MARIQLSGNFSPTTTPVTTTIYTVPAGVNLELDYAMINTIGSALGAAKNGMLEADGNIIGLLTAAGNGFGQAWEKPIVVTATLVIVTVGIVAGTVYWSFAGNQV